MILEKISWREIVDVSIGNGVSHAVPIIAIMRIHNIRGATNHGSIIHIMHTGQTKETSYGTRTTKAEILLWHASESGPGALLIKTKQPICFISD